MKHQTKLIIIFIVLFACLYSHEVGNIKVMIEKTNKIETKNTSK